MSHKYKLNHSGNSGEIKQYRTRRYSPRYGKNYSNRKPKALIIAIVSVICLVLCTTMLVTALNKPPTEENPTISDTNKVQKSKTEKATEKKAEKIIFNHAKNTTDIPKSNKAEYAIVINNDNTIVAERNCHKRTYPASTTKIMTLLVAAENIKDMNDTFTMSLEITDPLFIAGASVAGFKDGEKVSMTDLMYGTILPSGADAAIGLAIKVAGSEEKFVELMNKKVKELGLEDTHFANVTGLHDKNNYCSAYDMAIILKTALKNQTCKKILSTYQHTTAKTKQNPKGILLSSTLFNYMYGTEPQTATILGGKTGYVTEAGYCIASYGKANKTGNEYIIVTFDSPGLWPAFYGQINLYKKFAK